MPRPRVSVIVAVHDGEALLPECLQSLWRQTFDDFEIVVVDDGSEDGTWRYLSGVRDDRLHAIRSPRNEGCSAARNRAAGEARGEYLAVLDADDLALPDRLATQVRFLDAHPDHGIVGSFFELRSELGSADMARRPETDPDIRRSVCLGVPFLHSAVMMRAAAFREAGGYEPDFTHGEDYRLFARILARHRGANIPRVLAVKRETRQGLTFRLSAFDHFAMGLRNRLYVARRLDRTIRGYACAALGALAIPVIRKLGLNRETLRRLTGAGGAAGTT